MVSWKGGEKIMNKIYARLAGVGSAVGAISLLVQKALATPTYVMDTGLQTGVTTVFSDFITGAYTIIVAAIAVVGGYYVSIRLIHLFMGWIHKLGA
jgi:hypothetical protein